MKLFREEVDKNKYIIVTYFLKSKTNLAEACLNLAIGQSVGNPKIRNKWETDELFDNHSCLIIGKEEELVNSQSGKVDIAFPIINTNWESDGISHLLCQLMGGQLDIDNIEICHLLDLEIPTNLIDHYFRKPKYGIEGIRGKVKKYNKPILGAIVKPKTGISPEILLDMVKELVDGGVDFIKEDEILSNPAFCPLNKRVDMITNYLRKIGSNIIFAHCINSDPAHILQRVQDVYNLGGNAVHINFWSGLGVYNSIRQMDLPLFIHFQKSGDKILTDKSHRFHIDWKVICMLAGIMGVDFIHAGMWGGYMDDSKEELDKVMKVLHQYRVMPALSCGMHPGLVESINKNFGIDYMANVGGAIHGHPNGTLAGAKAMRQSIDKTYGEEYKTAIDKWGKA